MQPKYHVTLFMNVTTKPRSSLARKIETPELNTNSRTHTHTVQDTLQHTQRSSLTFDTQSNTHTRAQKPRFFFSTFSCNKQFLFQSHRLPSFFQISFHNQYLLFFNQSIYDRFFFVFINQNN